MTMPIKKAFQPGAGDVHVNRPLTNISIAFMQAAEAFVATRVFPNIPVDKQGDLFFTYPRGEFNRSMMQRRAPATESAGADYKIEQGNYFAHVYALHRDIADQVRANQDDPISLDREATEYLSLQAMLNMEIEFVDAFMKDSVWTYSVDGASARSAALDLTDAGNNDIVFWNNASSDPIQDVRLMKRTVLENTGFMPNVLLLGRVAYDTLLDHSDIIMRIDRGQTPGGPAMTTRQHLASLFEVDEILVMDAIRNTAGEGLTDSHSFINGKDGLLCYRAASPGIMTPSAGYTFAWNGYLGASDLGMRMSRFRHELIRADRVEIEQAFDMKVIAADLGVFLDGIVQ